MVASATAEQEVLGSIPGTDKVLLGFTIWNFFVAVAKSGFAPGGMVIGSPPQGTLKKQNT